ncbi:glycosyltransferase family 4 protein [Agrobacterium larrymoorei]|uniref:Glycosyltransferase involved in cell wall biosynthesis n=1 Tax=Agrobacterium larrymoorei TaxID=160699 RepID=A0ABU0UEI3_9HYPH|nr:glycosyltransferase family 4 protein [Agrobacterium larrymoorei]MDQ1183355.1 glycosyltransferase involved in cell wall biosynthesis [Agrobacterium larrymoorei]
MPGSKRVVDYAASKQTTALRARSNADEVHFPNLDGVRLCMIGLRGVPGVPGGIETHVEQLVPGLVERGADVHVYARQNYVAGEVPYVWRGVTVHPTWAPSNTRLEAIVHTLLALFKARMLKPDIVHIHAVGPSLVAPLARMMGMKVVFTHHGYDYDREKWNALEKKVLRLGEWAGMRFAQGRIVVAKHIADAMQAKFNRSVHFIPNGVQIDIGAADDGVLDEFGLTKGRYVLLVARLVVEKRQMDLIDAFLRADMPGTKLVLVGGGDARSDYAERLRARAKSHPNIVLTGSQSGARLGGLFANAGLFVLPSSHEGMPIALLEALAYGLPVLASDIEANLALELDAGSYFPLGDISALAQAMQAKLSERPAAAQASVEMGETGSTIMSRYNWNSICEQTASLYLSVLKRN